MIAEMVTGRPVFEGKDQSQTLNLIAGVLGPPSMDALNNMNVSKIDEKLKFAPPSQAGDWGKVFKRKIDPLLVDFISKLIAWDPCERITPLKALLHPFFNNLFDSHNPASEF